MLMSHRGLRIAEAVLDDMPSLGALRLPGEEVYEVYKPVRPLRIQRFGDRSYVHFGSTGAFGSILLDVESGNVMEMQTGGVLVKFVNESVDKFIECLQVFLSLLSSSEGDDEEVADELEVAVKEIDAQAYKENSFWYEVRWSVALGDFS
jgi:hypothetical protein